MAEVIYDDRELNLKLDRLAGGVKDFSKPLDDIGDSLIVFYGIDVMETQGARGDGPWKPLAPATLFARKERRGYYAAAPITQGKALIWTGRLRSAFRKFVEPTKLTINNPTPYYRKHQLGEGVPKRPMMMINDYVKELVNNKAIKYITDLLR